MLYNLYEEETADQTNILEEVIELHRVENWVMEESSSDGGEDDEEPSSPADVDIAGQRDTTEDLESEGNHGEVFWVG